MTDSQDDHEPLVSLENTRKYYADNDTLIDMLLRHEIQSVKAVDGIDLTIYEGETLGLVGESGCGKSTVAETVLGLTAATDGRVLFRGTDITELIGSDRESEFRKSTSIVFQDPYSSLDPRMTVREIIREPLNIHAVGTKAERQATVEELIERVGLSIDQLDRYPHEFSGGQRQRIGIARGLVLKPDFVVLDEPVSALDVSVQAQIINLLKDLQDEYNLTYLFIAHNLSVVRQMADRVAVMYLGKIVESGPTSVIFDEPSHPYTQKLLDSVPRTSVNERDREIEPISGDVPSPRDPPEGCRFHTRCPYAREACTESPPMYDLGDAHRTACYRSKSTHEYWENGELADQVQEQHPY